MKKIAFLLFCALFIAAVFAFRKEEPPKKSESKRTEASSPTPSIKPLSAFKKKTTSLFVPYWSVNAQAIESNGYDQLIYFAITVNEDGIDTTDSGYETVVQFIELSDDTKERLLTVRMLDSRINSKTLEDKHQQSRIIDQSIALAKDHGFDGIVLDFELPAIAFESVTKGISSFYKAFFQKVKENDLQFAITLYGDTFYRARPYDVKTLAKYTDRILIMTYDFHKARGNPGPNFPLQGKELYGYDLATMLTNFAAIVPKEKLTIVFGLFGYDWIVDTKNQSLQTAQPLSYSAIKKKFLNTCKELDCQIKRDKLSSETTIIYRDKEGKLHNVWFEDKESIAKKQAFLQEHGITSLSFWAYSYF